MRILTITFLFSSVMLFGQSSHLSGGLELPTVLPAAQQAEAISVPVCAKMQAVLESVRRALNGNANGYTNHEAMVAALIASPSTMESFVRNVRAVPVASTCTLSETISINLTAEQATLLEKLRINQRNVAPSVDHASGNVVFSPLFVTKEDLFRAALTAPNGPFWNYVLKFPPANVLALLAAGTPTSDAVIAAIKQIVQ